MTLRVLALSAVLASGLLAGAASAQVITDSTGKFAVGVGANGELVDNASGTGFRRLSDGFDPIAGSGGVGRDAWGANSAFADQNFFGSAGLTSSTVTAGAHSATATADTAGGLHIVQNYAFSAQNILSILTTVTNTSGAAQDLVFARDVDWNIDPTAFNERVFGPVGGPAFVLDSSFFGFEDPDTANSFIASCLNGCDSTGDLGGGIKIDMGLLANGASTSFQFFYGINQLGQSTDALVAQTQGLGAQYLIAGQDSAGHANSAVIGFAVPEPATWAMMLIGFFGLGAALRRRRAAGALAA